MMLEKLGTVLNILGALCWIGFVVLLVYDWHHQWLASTYLERRMDRLCAQRMGVPYTGKSCAQLRDEDSRRRSQRASYA